MRERQGDQMGADEEAGSASTDMQPTDGEGAFLDSPHLRHQMLQYRQLMKAGTFTDEELKQMTEAIGSILLTKQTSPREKIAAFKTLLTRAKLEHDIIKGSQPPSAGGVGNAGAQIHQHGHVHIHGNGSTNGIGADLLEIASGLGINVDLEAVDTDAPCSVDAAGWKDGDEGRTQQEDHRGTQA